MHTQENHMKQKIKVDLHIAQQTLRYIRNHLEGLHQKQFVLLVVWRLIIQCGNFNNKYFQHQV